MGNPIPPISSTPRLGDTPPTDAQQLQAVLTQLNYLVLSGDLSDPITHSKYAIQFAEDLAMAVRLAQSGDIPLSVKNLINGQPGSPGLLDLFKTYIETAPATPPNPPSFDAISQLILEALNASGGPISLPCVNSQSDLWEGQMMSLTWFMNASYWAGGNPSADSVQMIMHLYNTLAGEIAQSTDPNHGFQSSADYQTFWTQFSDLGTTLQTWYNLPTGYPAGVDEQMSQAMSSLFNGLTPVSNT